MLKPINCYTCSIKGLQEIPFSNVENVVRLTDRSDMNIAINSGC